MWACPYCIKKEKQVNCCGKYMCEHSFARFTKPEGLWDHLKIIHPKIYESLTKI